MALKLITAPLVEPVTLAEARAHLRATTTDEDALIQGWIAAARERAEDITHRRFITQTWDLVLDGFPSQFEMPNAPLVSVTSVKYLDEDDVEQTLASSAYQVDAVNQPGRILPAVNGEWPDTSEKINAVTVRFVCGYGLAAAVPFAIKAAMLLMIGHLDSHREDVSDFEHFQVPHNAEWLLWPYRVMGL